jgi:hypothetical protein
MKKSSKHLDFYLKAIKDEQMPYFGLCLCASNNLINYETFERFIPTPENEEKLKKEDLNLTYWGSGLSTNDHNRLYAFTPLRQTIVLFMAAINNEL